MLLPLLARPETAAEWVELQAAVFERLAELQQGWVQGWTAWLVQVDYGYWLARKLGTS